MGHLRGLPLLLITTFGRKTGRERVTPVMYIRDGRNYVVTASNNGAKGHPAWFLNLKANSRIIIEVDGLRKSVIAHQANPDDKGRLWPQLVEQAPFFEGYRRRTKRDIPMVILEPTNRESQVKMTSA